MMASRKDPPRRRLGGRLSMALAALLAAGLIVWGIFGRGTGASDHVAADADDPVQQVRLISPSRGPATRSLSLPGTIQAWYTAPIYAQVSGYVTMWYKDYGAPVHAGDLLSVIDTPGLDQQFETAKSNLEAAQDKYGIASLTAKRWKALAGTQAVARQEVDVQVATAASQAAEVQAAQHDVARFQALEQFKRVVAPFDGVVTSRNTDVGDYVNAAGGDVSSHGGSSELFAVSDIHKMRVFVSVPQDYSAMLKPGLTATLSLPQFPGRSFTATLKTTANAFDAQTRTVVSEFLVDNPDHLIWPGTYADVHFTTSADPDILIVPQQALLFDANGMQVALVGPDRKVHLQTIKPGLNLGETVQIVAGLKPTDSLIENPSAGLLDGEVVHVLPGQTDASSEPRGPGLALRAKIEAARADTAE